MRFSCHLVFFTFFLMSFTISSAKDNKDLMKAKFYYTHSVYYKAIPYYEKIADELHDPVIYAELGNCYSVTDNLPKAANAYAKAVNIKGCDSAVILRYAKVLMQLMQYDEAGKWLKAYRENHQDDRRVANMISGCNSANSVMESTPDGFATFLPFNTDGSEFAPTIWGNRLVFASDTSAEIKKKTDNWTGKAYYNLFSVPCDNNGQCANELDKIEGTKGVNIQYHDGPCTFSADGKQMYFTRSRYSNRFFGKKAVANEDNLVVLEIMIASDFDTAAKKFKTATAFQYNNEAYAVEHPSLSPNGKLLIFSSNKPKGYGGSDIYLCKKTADGSWSEPQNTGSILNTEGDEVFPCWGDNTTLFFSSDGHIGLGGLDIYKCIWDEHSGTFSEPENIGIPINSSYDDISLALYADGRSTYFSSNRPADKSSDNIYFFKKERIFLQVTVLDSLTGLPLPAADLSVISAKDKHEIKTDNKGQYFTRLYPEEKYSISISKNEYGPKKLDIYATGTKGTDTIFRTVKLYKPAPRLPDTIARIIPRNRNVMDTPGIRDFILGEIYELGHIYYDYDKFELKAVHKIILDTLLTQLNRHPTMRIQIRAHTDCRGSYEYNQVLSKNRALSVVNYLVEHGIPRSRLEYVGLGFSAPTIPCPDCKSCTEQQHYMNRLLDFKVLQL